MRTVRVGVVGLGTVGSGVVRILGKHAEDFRRRSGVDLALASVVDRDLSRVEQLGIDPGIASDDWRSVVEDPSIDVVVELIGGTGVARDCVLSALRAGKNVVTANKALIAAHGEEVMQAAEASGVDIRFEASVGGGIPIIEPLKHALVSNEIVSVTGIVNGTTNYMLTRMSEDGLDYESALAEAQERGFAEADPSADVDGLDAAAKIAILASIAFNSRVVLSQVPAEGIRAIAPADIQYAAEMGRAIKLLAIARRVGADIDVRVHPTMIPMSHPLASVNGVYNAIYVVGDAVGETMFFGEGAGSLPAASAVVGDLIEVARRVQMGCPPLVGCTCTESHPVRDLSDLECRYYLRMDVEDRPGVLAATSAVFAEQDVSLASVIQRTPRGREAELVYVTHSTRESSLRRAIEGIESLDTVHSVASVIRVEDL